MKNGRLMPAVHSSAAIYATHTNCLSRPMTGHTPQKLPPYGAISCIIAVARADFPHTRPHIVIHAPVNVKPFFVIFHKFFEETLWETEKKRGCPPRFSLPAFCRFEHARHKVQGAVIPPEQQSPRSRHPSACRHCRVRSEHTTFRRTARDPCKTDRSRRRSERGQCAR